MWRDPWFWREETLAARLVTTALSPLGMLYHAIGKARMHRIKPEPLGTCAIICIGNASLGGVGKTPFAIALYRMLTDRLGNDDAIGFLTRGYGGSLAGPVRVDPKTHTAEMVGDEALLLARHGPVWLARDRKAGADFAATHGARCLLCDDGYQNPRLPKDLSILLVPVPIPARAQIFPAGPLREPVADAAARADAVVFVTQDGTDEFPKTGTEPLIRILTDRRLSGRAWLSPTEAWMGAGQAGPVLAFCGIGNPDRFRQTLHAAGAAIADFIAFPDHYPYNDDDIRALRRAAKRHGARLITTEKDHVRLPSAFAADVDTLPVSMTILCDGLIDRCLAVLPQNAHRPVSS
ncbi:MAG: tetraacyldisaccharide 4'-kinase [Pseudomonadota bacterium]